MNTLLCIESGREGKFMVEEIHEPGVEVYSKQGLCEMVLSGVAIGKEYSLLIQTSEGPISFSYTATEERKEETIKCFIEGSTSSLSFTAVLCTPFRTEIGKERDIVLPQRFSISHRGSGATQVNDKHLENTMESFLNAYNDNSRFIEFDIQLSKEGTPLIYHDFYYMSEELDTRLGEPLHQDTAGKYAYPLNSFTNEDFVNSGYGTKYQVPRPLFSELLEKLPEDLGFDIEMKYPFLPKWRGKVPFSERNTFIDSVLEVLLSHPQPRRNMFFSSFDPFVVMMLSIKQKRWPVFQLATPIHEDNDPPDAIASLIRPMLPIYQMLGVAGFVVNSKYLLRNSFLVKEMQDAGFVVATYGTPNNLSDKIQEQLNLGINGICSDFSPLCLSVINSYKEE